jgi:pimeloyl-ACP methyl ester carboxylesterase
MKTAIVLASLLFAFAAGAADAAPRASASTAYLHPQRLVAVQGMRRLNLYCVGHGRPTVVFDSGLGDSMAVWRLVQGSVGKVTRACAYDRAGYGFSDPPSGISDASAAVEDLHRLIAVAPIATPIVYVGHSIAGLYGVLLEAKYPQDVAAEVLVDPSYANQFFAAAAILPPQQRVKWLARMTGSVAHIRKCAAMQAPLPRNCIDGDSMSRPGDTELAALEKQRVSRPSYLLADASEFESFIPDHGRKGRSQKEVEAVRPDFGEKPLVILTHSDSEQDPDLTPAQNAAMDRAWNAGHDRLAGLSKRGSNRIVPNSHHSIQMDQPQAVIDAVLEVVEEVRGGR